MSNLIDEFDSNFENEGGIRHAIVDIIESRRAEIPAIRMVEEDTLFQVAERCLESNVDLEPDVRYFSALREVNNFITFATEGAISETVAKHADLLPASHPNSKESAVMTASAQRMLRAEWLAADTRITDENVRAVVAAVYASNPMSVDYAYNISRLESLAEGQVPADLLIKPLLAFGDPYAGKNSFWHRSMRAKGQRRDDEGQFAEMGGGYRFYVKDARGRVFSVVGKVAGIPENDPLGIDIEVSGVEGIRDGIYTIPAAAGHAFKAILPEHAVSKRIRISGDNLNAIDLSSLTRKELPTSWFPTKSSNDNTNLDNQAKADRFFATGDGYAANLYNNPAEDLAKRIAEAATKFGAVVSSDQGTDTLNPDKPVYELISTKRGQPEVVGYAQDWATVQKFASEEDERYPEAENEPLKDADQAEPAQEQVAEEAPEDVVPAFDPVATMPEGWTQTGDMQFTSADGRFLARYGIAPVGTRDISHTDDITGLDDSYTVPVGVDNAFLVNDYLDGSTAGIAFDWDGVAEAMSYAYDGVGGVDEMSESSGGLNVNPDDLSPERFKYVDPEPSFANQANANDDPDQRLQSATFAAMSSHTPSKEIVDMYDEITGRGQARGDWSPYTTAQIRTLKWHIEKSPSVPNRAAAQPGQRQALRNALKKREIPEKVRARIEAEYHTYGSDEIKEQLENINNTFPLKGQPTQTDSEGKTVPAKSAGTAGLPAISKLDDKVLFTPRSPNMDFPLKKLENAFGNHEVTNEMIALFDDMHINRGKYFDNKLAKFTEILNAQPEKPNGLATWKQRSLLRRWANEQGVPGNISKDVLDNYYSYDYATADQKIKELTQFINLEKLQGRPETPEERAVRLGLSSVEPKYLGTDLVDGQNPPRPGMFVVLETLIEGRDFSDPAAKNLLDQLMQGHRKMTWAEIGQYIGSFQSLPYKKQYQPKMLTTNVSREDGGPTDRMLRSLERSYIKGLIPQGTWDQVVKEIPNMMGEAIATRWIVPLKDMEDKYDTAVLERSIKGGYEIAGLRRPAKLTIDIPEDYVPSKPGVWIGKTEDEINKILDGNGGTQVSPVTNVGLLDALSNIEQAISLNQYESTLELAEIDDFLKRETLRADLKRTRGILSDVSAVVADLLNNRDRGSLKPDAVKILQNTLVELSHLKGIMDLRRANVISKKEYDKRLIELAKAIIPGEDSASPLGTLKSKTPETLEILSRAQAAVASAIGKYTQGGFASDAPSAVDEMSTPVKPSMRFAYPPTFAGEGLDALKGVDNFDEVISFLRSNDIYVLDLETTGLTDLDDRDIRNDPIQIAVTKLSGLEPVDSFTTYINPESKISSYTLKGVGDGKGGKVTKEFLESFPSKREAMQQLLDFIPAGSIIAGHNSTLFDMEVIDRTMEEAGLDGLKPAGMVDTLGLARYIMPEWTPENPDAPFKINYKGEQTKSFSLEALVTYFGLSNNGRHEADADVASTVQVLQKMLDRAQRGLGVQGRAFDYNASDNGWNYEEHMAAVQAYEESANLYIMGRVVERLIDAAESREGDTPTEGEVNDTINSIINSINGAVVSGQEENREEVNIPALNPLRDLPAGTYVHDNDSGRVGISMGIVGNHVLVDMPSPDILATGKMILEYILPGSLAKVNDLFRSKNDVLLEHGMQVRSSKIPGEYGYVRHLVGGNVNNVYVGAGDFLAAIPSRDLEVVPTVAETAMATNETSDMLTNLIDELVSAGILNRAAANIYQKAVDGNMYTQEVANRVFMRLNTALQQVRQSQANTDIDVPEGDRAASSVVDEMAAPKKPKDTKKVEDIEFSKALEKAIKELDLTPTAEGRNIIGAIVNRLNVVVQALAGVGKTTNLRLTAEVIQKLYPALRILYIVFNKQNQMEADANMPLNTEARTSDSISTRAVVNAGMVSKYKAMFKQTSDENRPVSMFVPKDLAQVFGAKDSTMSSGKEIPAERVAGIAATALRKWITSDSMKIDKSTVEAIFPTLRKDEIPTTDADYEPFIKMIQAMWADITSDHDDTRRQIAISWPHWFKNWALTRPNLMETDGSGKSIHGLDEVSDILLLDEAQDINPVFRQIIEDQYKLHKNGMQIVLVGDTNQKIMGFRGSEDSLGKVQRDLTLPLTQSYRTGQEALDAAANKVLVALGSASQLVGKPNGTTKLIKDMPEERIDLALSRGTAAILREAIKVAEQFEDGRIGVTLNYKSEIQSMLDGLNYLNSVSYVKYFNEEEKKKPKEEQMPLRELPSFPKNMPGSLIGFTWESLVDMVSNEGGDQGIQQVWNTIRSYASKNKIKIGKAISDLRKNVVPTLRVLNNEFSIPQEVGSSGSLGLGLNYEITKDRIVISDDPNYRSHRFQALQKTYNNRVALEDAGFFNYTKDPDTGRYGAFQWEAEVFDDGRDQLEELVSKLRGKDAMYQVMTGHTSKGLEADNVKILDDWMDISPFLPGGDDAAMKKMLAQFRQRGSDFDIMEEIRLIYVVTTRAKNEMDLGSLEYLRYLSADQIRYAIDMIVGMLNEPVLDQEEGTPEFKSPEEIEAIKSRPTGEDLSGLGPRGPGVGFRERPWNPEDEEKPKDEGISLKPRSRDKVADSDGGEVDEMSYKRPTSKWYQGEYDEEVKKLKDAISVAKEALKMVPEDRADGLADPNVEDTIVRLESDLNTLRNDPDMLERSDDDDYKSAKRILATLNADMTAKLDVLTVMEARRLVKNRTELGTGSGFVYGNSPAIQVNRRILEGVQAAKDVLYDKLKLYDKLIEDINTDAPGQVDESSVSSEDASPEVKEKLYNIVEEAAKFYSERLMSYDDSGATAAKKYVVSRGFSAADAGNFKIGYSSSNWADLYQHLRRKGFSEEEILQTKLVMRSANNGRLYDAMRNRIVFPLVDENGKAVAFTGRSIDPEEKNRYMLTGGTPIFKKSQAAFGLGQAADEIAKTGEMVVVEGQFDAMAMHAAGIKNAVAVSGTDFAANHIAMFERLAKDKKDKSIVFAFDSDEAGLRAAGRAFMAMSWSYPDITPYIVTDESGLDPADIYSKDNENGLKTLMDNKKHLGEALIERLLSSGKDLDSIKGMIISILRNIDNLDLQTRLTQRFASQLGEDVGSLMAEVRMSGPDRSAKIEI